jgi:hypothetical protein
MEKPTVKHLSKLDSGESEEEEKARRVLFMPDASQEEFVAA